MQRERGRTTILWMADHALVLAGAILLAGGLVWSPWLFPWGWTALGIALLGWIAETNGYAIPRPGRVPIEGLGCCEVPVAFGVRRKGRHLLFTRAGTGIDAPWRDEYAVYEVPSVGTLQVATGVWQPPAGSRRYDVLVPAAALRFEHHERSYVDTASLSRALRGVGPSAD